MDQTLKPAYSANGSFYDITRDAQKRGEVERYREASGLRLYNSHPGHATLQIRGVAPLQTGRGQRDRAERVLYADMVLSRADILALMAALDHAYQDAA